jgi:sulfite exporter TauE/SafE
MPGAFLPRLKDYASLAGRLAPGEVACAWEVTVDFETRTFGALFLSGLLGSLGHCLGMCGPLVTMFGVQLKARRLAGLPYHLLYHTSRTGVYALFGALVGGLGSALGLGESLGRVAAAISLLLGLSIVLLGLGYLGWLPLGRIEGMGAWLNRTMAWALHRGSLVRVLAIGALNGLLPCGLVYSALLVAATTGGLVAGAAAMAVFGLGTMPALVALGVGTGALSARVRQVFVRVAGALIVIVGLQLALRGLAAWELVPHLYLGKVMIW